MDTKIRTIEIPINRKDAKSSEFVQIPVDNLPKVDYLISILTKENSESKLYKIFAIVYYRKGDYDAFLALLKAALKNIRTAGSAELDNEKIEIYNCLANYYIHMARQEYNHVNRKDFYLKEAISQYNLSDQINPRAYSTWLGKGATLVIANNISDFPRADYQFEYILQNESAKHKDALAIPSLIGKANLNFVQNYYHDALLLYKQAFDRISKCELYNFDKVNAKYTEASSDVMFVRESYQFYYNFIRTAIGICHYKLNNTGMARTCFVSEFNNYMASFTASNSDISVTEIQPVINQSNTSETNNNSNNSLTLTVLQTILEKTESLSDVEATFISQSVIGMTLLELNSIYKATAAQYKPTQQESAIPEPFVKEKMEIIFNIFKKNITLLNANIGSKSAGVDRGHVQNAMLLNFVCEHLFAQSVLNDTFHEISTAEKIKKLALLSFTMLKNYNNSNPDKEIMDSQKIKDRKVGTNFAYKKSANSSNSNSVNPSTKKFKSDTLEDHLDQAEEEIPLISEYNQCKSESLFQIARMAHVLNMKKGDLI